MKRVNGQSFKKLHICSIIENNEKKNTKLFNINYSSIQNANREKTSIHSSIHTSHSASFREEEHGGKLMAGSPGMSRVPKIVHIRPYHDEKDNTRPPLSTSRRNGTKSTEDITERGGATVVCGAEDVCDGDRTRWESPSSPHRRGGGRGFQDVVEPLPAGYAATEPASQRKGVCSI